MNAQTTDPGRARKRLKAVESRMLRYPDHPQMAKMEDMRARYLAAIEEAGKPRRPPDRMLNRVETLVQAIREVNAALDADSKHPNKKRMLERLAEYQISLRNIQEFGRERVSRNPVGVKIEVPADVLEQRSE